MIRVTLTPFEERWASEIAEIRIEESKRLEPSFDPKTMSFGHRMGALGELAFCKAVGFVWPARYNQFKTKLPDVDPFWEVRWSSSVRYVKVRRAPAHGRRLTDRPDQLVVHVTGKPPTFDVHGYVSAAWAQQNIPLSDPGHRKVPAHFARPEHLSPINPGFHGLCAWARTERGWLCLYCGTAYQGPLP